MSALPAFYQAVCDGAVAAVSAALQADAGLLHAKYEGATPLHFAAFHNQREVADLLLERDADINATDDEYGATPAGWANEKGYVEMLHYLVARGTHVDLNRAAAFGLHDRVLELLEAGEDVNTISGFGTPLHEAAVWGHPDIAALLLGRGADVTLKNTDGQTALEIAQRQLSSQGQGTPLVIPERHQAILAGCAAVVALLQSNA